MNQIFEWFMNNPWATALLMVLFIAVSALMVLAILIQRPQGGGLSAAFGGGSAGSGQTAFGTKTGDALTWFTISVFAAFLLFGILLNYATTPAAIAPVPEATAPSGTQGPAGATPTQPDQVPPVNPPADEKSGAVTPTSPATTPGASPAAEPAPSPAPSETPAPADPKPVEPAPKK
ncbi:MAG: preprotein translocase subunit SecG [Phycisphaeraceae bacterium]|nr:preprotein translocase subunit SecG [Phycisphaeraceae bacterium]